MERKEGDREMLGGEGGQAPPLFMELHLKGKPAQKTCEGARPSHLSTEHPRFPRPNRES